MEDQLFCQHVSFFFPRHLHKSREYTGITRNNSKFFFSVFLLQYDNCIDTFIFQKWKRLSFSDNNWRNERGNLCIKILFQIFSFFFANFTEIHKANPCLCNFIHQIFIDCIFSAVQLCDPCQDCLNLFFCCHSSFIVFYIFRNNHLIDQRSYTHHEKFI